MRAGGRYGERVSEVSLTEACRHPSSSVPHHPLPAKAVGGRAAATGDNESLAEGAKGGGRRNSRVPPSTASAGMLSDVKKPRTRCVFRATKKHGENAERTWFRRERRRLQSII